MEPLEAEHQEGKKEAKKSQGREEGGPSARGLPHPPSLPPSFSFSLRKLTRDDHPPPSFDIVPESEAPRDLSRVSCCPGVELVLLCLCSC